MSLYLVPDMCHDVFCPHRSCNVCGWKERSRRCPDGETGAVACLIQKDRLLFSVQRSSGVKRSGVLRSGIGRSKLAHGNLFLEETNNPLRTWATSEEVESFGLVPATVFEVGQEIWNVNPREGAWIGGRRGVEKDAICSVTRVSVTRLRS